MTIFGQCHNVLNNKTRYPPLPMILHCIGSLRSCCFHFVCGSHVGLAEDKLANILIPEDIPTLFASSFDSNS